MSYVVVSAEKARELAQKTLDRIKAARKRALDEHLKEEVAKINGRWWRRLFKLEPVSEQEYYEANHSNPWWLSGGYINQIEVMHYWRQEEVAEDILRAATLGNPLHIDVEDSEYLGDWA